MRLFFLWCLTSGTQEGGEDQGEDRAFIGRHCPLEKGYAELAAREVSGVHERSGLLADQEEGEVGVDVGGKVRVRVAWWRSKVGVTLSLTQSSF